MHILKNAKHLKSSPHIPSKDNMLEAANHQIIPVPKPLHRSAALHIVLIHNRLRRNAQSPVKSQSSQNALTSAQIVLIR